MADSIMIMDNIFFKDTSNRCVELRIGVTLNSIRVSENSVPRELSGSDILSLADTHIKAIRNECIKGFGSGSHYPNGKQISSSFKINECDISIRVYCDSDSNNNYNSSYYNATEIEIIKTPQSSDSLDGICIENVPIPFNRVIAFTNKNANILLNEAENEVKKVLSKKTK